MATTAAPPIPTAELPAWHVLSRAGAEHEAGEDLARTLICIGAGLTVVAVSEVWKLMLRRRAAHVDLRTTEAVPA
jgi:hypothetical protein